MFDFILSDGSGKDAYHRKSHAFPRHDYVQVGMEKNLDKALKHHFKIPAYIASDNLLMQILEHVPILDKGSKVTRAEYKDRFHNELFEMATLFDLGYMNNVPSFKDQNIYGNIKELWVLDHDYMMNEDMLTVIRHPFTYSNLGLFDGQYDYMDGKLHLAVIKINIPEIAWRYNQWRLIQLDLPPEKQEPKGVWVSTVLLPSLLPSHQTVSIFNRLHQKLDMGVYLVDKGRSGLTLIDYTDKLDDSTDEILEFLITDRTGVREMFDVIPLTKGHTLNDLPTLVGMPDNRNMDWLSLVGNGPLIRFIFLVKALNGTTLGNRMKMNVKKKIKFVKNDGGLRNQLDKDGQYHVINEVNGITDLL